MRRRSSCPRILLLAAVALIAMPGEPECGYRIRPGALSVLASGELLVLDGDRGLFRFSPDSGAPVPIAQFGLFSGVDLASAAIGGTESAFVILQSTASSELRRIDLGSRKIEKWRLPLWRGNLSGVALDPQGKLAYVAGGRSDEIYKVDLGRPSSLGVRFTRVQIGANLGPIVLDRKRTRLLMADERGSIFGVDLATGSARLIASFAGEASALVVNARTDELLIADSLGRKIWKLALGSEATRPVQLVRLKEFRSPLGLALGPGGAIWVGDELAGAIFLLDQNGRLLRTFKL
jgi:streptogramin lyase